MRKFLLLLALLISGVGLASAQSEVVIGNGTYSGYDAPFNNYYKHSWNETIYQKGDIGGAGTITSVSYHRASGSSYTTQTIKIYMGETTRSSISSTTDWTPANQLTLVYSGSNITIGDSEWETFTLNTPFEYSGENNLVVVVAKTASSYTSSLKWYYTNSSNGSNVTMYRQDDTNTSYAQHPSTNSGSQLNYAANIKLEGKFGDDGENNDPNDYEYVDLNLPSGLKWATCNIGANTPEEYGNTYAWGETKPKAEYTEANSLTNGKLMNDISGNANYDAATANWGGDWRLPRKEEMEELISQCNWIWTTQNGVRGYKVVSKTNGKYIFLPAAGYIYGTNRGSEGNIGNYWTSTPESYGDYPQGGASGLDYFNDNYASGASSVHMYTFYRPGGLKVRPVFGGNFDGPVAQYASVTTNEVSGVSKTTAVCGGNVTSDNGSTVTAKGVCWSTSANPTIEDNKTVDGSGVGAFTSNLSNLSPMTTYYVRAYVTNAAGTRYGVQRSFTTIGDIEIGDTQVINYGKYILKFTVTHAAQCEVICTSIPSSNTSITIPSSVTFNGIACSVTSIGNNAFEKCYSYVTSITIPSSITSIGTSAFEGCSSLTSISIPAGVTSIGSSAFKGCSSLTSIVIPGGITSIGTSAFEGCSSLTSVDIPYGVTSIGDYAFDYCGGLTSITIPSSVTSIGNYAFQDCWRVKSLEIPSSVETIGTMAFAFMSTLKDVEISNGVTTIGNSAFHNCSSLTSIEIPNSVTTMGNSIFKYCYSLTSVIIHGNITSIGSSTFYNCDELTSVEMPNTIISIGESAFEGCSLLTDLEIPSGVISIGNSAFKGCSSFTNIEIPNSVTSLGNEAFSTCSSLKNIKCYAETVPSAGSGVFESCHSNMVIYVPSASLEAYQTTEPWKSYNLHSFGSVGDYMEVDYDSYILKYVVTNVEPNECEVVCKTKPTSETSITIPSSVTIDGKEFSVTTIGNSAFDGCTSLTSIEIPDGVTTIGNSAFYNCSSLTSVIIPSSVTSIGSYAFYKCSSLTSIDIPDGVVLIDDYAFYNCSSLTNIDIPDGVTSIGYHAFHNCSSLTNIEIPDGVTSIFSYAFSGCSSLISVDIPEGVTTIGNYTFYYCSSLSSVVIPSSVTSIGDSFYKCSSSLTIYSYNTTPATLSNSGALNNPAKIYVPSISLNDYKSKWYNYSSIIVGMPTYTENGWSTQPASSDDVAVVGDLVINNGEILNVNSLGICNGGRVTVKDGGQLVCNKSNGNITIEKEIEGYASQDDNSWHTIASPLKGETDLAGSSVNNIFNNQYDLYRYDEPTHTWQNYKNSVNNGFTTLELGRGYLYANAEDVTLEFTGAVNTEDVTYNLTAQGEKLNGFHLIGNPFTHDIYMNQIGTIGEHEIVTVKSPVVVFKLYDSDGDGWNGNKLNVSFSDGTSSKTYTISNGRSATHSVELAAGVEVTVKWTKGSYSDECSFVIEYEEGEPIFSKESGSLSNVSSDTQLCKFTTKEILKTEVTEIVIPNMLVNGYYTLNGDGAWEANPMSKEDAIKPMQGILVKALQEGELTISRQQSAVSRQQFRNRQQTTDNRQQSLCISVSNGKYSDRAFVVFDNGIGLDKINHENENIPLLYIPVDGTDYAIAMMDMNFNEIPVNFETNVMGEYTISLRQENCEFEELYLLDKETNTTVNILAEDYTFIATSNENPERFMLLKVNSQQTTDNSHFAYVNNGELIVETEGPVQIIDMMGRIVMTEECHNGSINISSLKNTAYIVRCLNENEVKTQKIVVL